MVKGDEGWLGRLLLILLDNAIKFTPDGGRIVAHVRPRSKGLAHVAVTDTGTGIPADALPHLFERFYRADPARSRVQPRAPASGWRWRNGSRNTTAGPST